MGDMVHILISDIANYSFEYVNYDKMYDCDTENLSQTEFSDFAMANATFNNNICILA